MAIRAASETSQPSEAIEERIFTERYLLRRPLLDAILQEMPPVLLIDEIDRADEALEAYLLEIIADFQVTEPELGILHPVSRPHVILTSNATRELSDALRRRCLYSFVPYPDRRTKVAILRYRAPDAEPALAAQIVDFVQALRREDLAKRPGIAETVDWLAALAGLGLNDLAGDPGLPLEDPRRSGPDYPGGHRPADRQGRLSDVSQPLSGARQRLGRALAGLATIHVHNPSEVRLALKSLLASSAKDWQRFDALFESYRLNTNRARERQRVGTTHAKPTLPSLWRDQQASAGSDAQPTGTSDDDGPQGEGRLVASRKTRRRSTQSTGGPPS